MTYRTTVLPNGRIDADALPSFPPGSQVEIKVERTVESLRAFFREMEELGKDLEPGFGRTYRREDYYDDHD